MRPNEARQLSAGKPSESDVLNCQEDGAYYRDGGGRRHLSIHLSTPGRVSSIELIEMGKTDPETGLGIK